MRLGKITENALKRSVLKQLNTEYKKEASAAVGTDCAFSKKQKTYSAVCPLTADVKDSGYYAVVKAVNSLVSQGVTPDQVNISILLPVDAEEPTIKKIVKDALDAARVCNVAYTGGHTEVTNAVSRPVVTATCVGTAEDALFIGKGKAGQDLVISKWVGLEGTSILAAQKKNELTTKYPAPFIDDAADFKKLLTVFDEMEVARSYGVSAVHDLSNGGVFAGLWEMAERAGTGLKVDLKAIPIRQETIEICEFFELNPYQLLSGGALIFAADDGERLVASLMEKGVYAACVGQLVSGNDRTITNLDETRFLEMPQADEIHKVDLSD